MCQTTTGYGYNRQILQGSMDNMHTSSLCVGYSQGIQKEVCNGGMNISRNLIEQPTGVNESYNYVRTF